MNRTGAILCGALWVLFALVSCSVDTANGNGGSGVDVGNPTAVGRLVDHQATGTLYDLDGQPIVGAVVTMIDTAYNPLLKTNSTPVLADTTDENGSYTLNRPEAMEDYTLFAKFPGGYSFAFSPMGVETDSLDFTVPVGPDGVIELYLPRSSIADTAGLFLWLKGSEIWGSAGSMFAGNYTWGTGDSLFFALRLKGIPFGFAPELRWYNSRADRGDWIIRGYGVYGDTLQIIARPCDDRLCVLSIYRLPLKR